ncbi:binary toxin-like calcium binding domain-containing protein [Bacillus thuringiensis]|uniref:binary toxin-like calcium binding domain-containing protein n=1 Tax=Bacillus thuringiensis TaxID=1428 RepID=UPI0011A6C5AF|nr:binary toxin-like calcium binding domain-containing protein [Bacillus thuringiensis]
MKYLTGLLGYYYTSSKPNPANLAFVYTDKTSLLGQWATSDIQCIRWDGYIKPSVTGEFYFYTSSDSNVVLQINGQIVVNQDNVTAVILNKDQLYPLLVEYRANADQVGTGMPPLQLYWSYNNGDILSIPDENILQPNSSTDVTYEDGTDTKLFQFQNIISNGTEFVVDASGAAPAPGEEVDESLDTDGDRIPNVLEQKGWAYNPLTTQVRLWDPEKDKGRPKYVTNPILYSTTGDPFSDLQHVNSNMAGENGKSSEVTRVDETHHPLVAIFPSVRVHVLGFIMASNGNVTTGQLTQNSTTVASSNMTSKTTQWDVHGDYHVSAGFPVGVQAGWSVGGGYGQSNTNSSTAEFSQTGSNTNHHDFSYQPSHAANIGFVVQYENIGTAAIEKLQPNFNVYMGKETQPFVTIQVKENAATLNLGPGEKSIPALISTNDDFSAAPITINVEQQEKLLTGVPIRIEVRDVKGDFGLNTKRPWSHFETHLKSQTARLTLIGKDGKAYDRRIACCKPEPKENEVSYTPEITLQEAISLAFGGKDNGNGGISFVDKDITFDKNSRIILDQTTEKLANSKNLTNVMSMQLRPGMGIMIYETKPTPEPKYPFCRDTTSNTLRETQFYKWESNNNGIRIDYKFPREVPHNEVEDMFDKLFFKGFWDKNLVENVELIGIVKQLDNTFKEIVIPKRIWNTQSGVIGNGIGWYPGYDAFPARFVISIALNSSSFQLKKGDTIRLTYKDSNTQDKCTILETQLP